MGSFFLFSTEIFKELLILYLEVKIVKVLEFMIEIFVLSSVLNY